MEAIVFCSLCDIFICIIINTTWAASETLGSWFVALLPHQAMSLQAAFVHEDTSQNCFQKDFWSSVMV